MKKTKFLILRFYSGLTLNFVEGLILFLFFFFLLKVSATLSAAGAGVVFNEICWMGNEASSANEWIELYNPTETVVSLAGWEISDQKGKLKINLEGEVKPNNFFLLERTDDESVPNIPADQIYKGALANQGEKLILKAAPRSVPTLGRTTTGDKNEEIIDLIDCSNGWFAGDQETRQTMSRLSSLISGNLASNWANSQMPSGTPKEKNNFLKEEVRPKSDSNSRSEKEEVIFVKIEEIDKSLIGKLIKTEGQVIEKTGRKIFLEDEGNPNPDLGRDGVNKEIVVYLKEEINLKDLKIKEGDFLKVQGFLKIYQDELRLLISQKEDLEIIKHNDNLEEEVVVINLAGSEGASGETRDIKNILLKSLVILGLILIFLKILSKSSSRKA